MSGECDICGSTDHVENYHKEKTMIPLTDEEIDEITSTDLCLFGYHKIDGIELAQRIFRSCEQRYLPEIESLNERIAFQVEANDILYGEQRTKIKELEDKVDQCSTDAQFFIREAKKQRDNMQSLLNELKVLCDCSIDDKDTIRSITAIINKYKK